MDIATKSELGNETAEDIESIDNIRMFLEETKKTPVEQHKDSSEFDDDSDVGEFFNAAELRDFEEEEEEVIIKIEPDTDVSEAGDLFKCERCSKPFENLKELVVHNRKEHYKKRKTASTRHKSNQTKKRTRKQVAFRQLKQTARKKGKRKKHWCIKCYMSFDTLEELEEHRLTPMHAKLPTCDVCNKTFKRKYMLRFHMKTHMKDDQRLFVNYKCILCDEILNTFAKVILHHAEQHEGEHTCILCNEIHRFGYKNHLLSHRKRLYKCIPCDKVFDSNEDLKAHYHSKEHQEAKTCPFCNRVFLRPFMKRAHIASSHKDKLDNIEERFQCDLCGSMYAARASLSKHKLRKHRAGDRIVKCKICGVLKGSNISLRNHVERAHVKQIREVVCYICYEKLTVKGIGAEESHYQTHPEHSELENLEAKCPKCNKTTRSGVDFFDHVLKQHKQYSCYKCRTSYASKGSVRTHIKYHDRISNMEFKEGGVKCLICEKEFKSKSTLRYHMFLHTGQKPYACKICEKSFRKPYHVKVHMRVHEECFPCTECDERFASKADLKVHLSQAHTDKVFCKICQKHYKSRILLKQHNERMHKDGQKPKTKSIVDEVIAGFSVEPKKYGLEEYKCGFCIRKFKSKIARQNHERKFHPQNVSDIQMMNLKDVLDPRRIDCAFCERYFKSKRAHENHVRRAHPQVGVLEQNEDGDEAVSETEYADAEVQDREYEMLEWEQQQDCEEGILETQEVTADEERVILETEEVTESGEQVILESIDYQPGIDEMNETEETTQVVYVDGAHGEGFAESNEASEEEEFDDGNEGIEIVLDQPIEDILEREGEVIIQTC